MALHELERIQKFPVGIEVVWDFFSHPNNLKIITPPDMKFIQLTTLNNDAEMYKGMKIEYKVAPVLGIFMKWETEISEVNKLDYFVDEQRSGPFSVWKHKHIFKSIDGGTEMTDYLQYKPPFGFLGGIADALFIKKQVQKIFDFRCKKLEEIFGKIN